MKKIPFAIVLFFLSCGSFGSPSLGEYLDKLRLEDVGDGRKFKLLGEYKYKDPKGTIWVVPEGVIVDGASIPEPFWSIVGSPWSGKYRNASVIHDYFFDRKKYSSESVHRVFYDAMLTSGVPILKAKIMYFAVVRFNSRWEQSDFLPECNARWVNCYPVLAGEPITVRIDVDFVKSELEAAEAYIRATNLPVEDVETLANIGFKNARSRK